MRCFQNFLPSNQIPTLATIRRFPALWLILLIVAPGFYAHGQMKLLAPGTGWVRYGDSVFFTRDNGTHWNNITPHAPGVPKAANIGPIFFRDGSEGWAVESYQERTAPMPEAMRNAKTIYVVLHTEDSGESWSSWPLSYPALPEWVEETFAGPANIFFLDSTHGWMGMAYAGMSHPGKLLATNDGGQTWNWVKSPPFSGQIEFTSLNDGWLVNSWGGDTLYATHDGAKSWQKVKITPPPDVRPTDRPLFSPPQFQDGRAGYLPVKYIGPFGTPSKLVVYATRSRGKAWRVIKQLSVPADAAFAMTDSILVLPAEAPNEQLSTTSVSVSGPNKPVVRVSARGVLAFSFHDKNDGWARRLNGLYETADGGATWIKITPPAALPPPSRKKVVLPSKFEPSAEQSLVRQPLVNQASNGGFGSAAHLSRHLGFDVSAVQTPQNMEEWWKWSPYYDTSLYLPGAVNRRHDANLSASWVTQIQAQGWGLIPIWVGLQAPCNDVNRQAPGTYAVFSTDPTTAASQGTSEADAAAACSGKYGRS